MSLCLSVTQTVRVVPCYLCQVRESIGLWAELLLKGKGGRYCTDVFLCILLIVSLQIPVIIHFKAIVQIQDKDKFLSTSSMTGLDFFPFPPLSQPPMLGGREEKEVRRRMRKGFADYWRSLSLHSLPIHFPYFRSQHLDTDCAEEGSCVQWKRI